jgi:hypothetical protein
VVDNPYYGAAMKTCGEIKKNVDAGTVLLKEDETTAAGAGPAGGHVH